MLSSSMDFITTSLNPCSLESIPVPVKLADEKLVWPVMLSCYELNNDGSRQGSLHLYAIDVPIIDEENPSLMHLKFGTPISAFDATKGSSGILDGKWFPKLANSTFVSKRWYATAHATGEVYIHCFSVEKCIQDPNLAKTPLAFKFAGKSSSRLSDTHAPLCLSLNWDEMVQGGHNRIVSTYSNGKVAIHDVVFSKANGTCELMERDCWLAHEIFTSPAEVWSACFAHEDSGNIVLSGGDEGCLKIWDVRSTTRPMQVFKHFNAGVTVVSPHPRREHLVACGSYDETLGLYDIRYASQRLLSKSEPLGGGIWRIQWHPYDDCRILVAAMHGGCCIVNVDELNRQISSSQPSFSVVKRFTKHESMAYGADWLVWKLPSRERYFEAAVSCSFYDRATYIWGTGE